MLHVLSLVAPVFGLIAVGWVAARSGYMSQGAGRVVTELAFKIAVPALLFRAMLGVGAVPASPLKLAAAYAASVIVVWLLAALATRYLLGRPAPDEPAFAMATTFGNGVMLGFPVMLATLGPQAGTPLAILAVCDSLLLWMLGILHMEIALRRGAGLDARAFLGVVRDVARNPLVVALVAGIAVRLSGLTLPEGPARLLDLLAQAGVPVALLGLGMSLATYEIKGEAPAIGLITLTKLVLAPCVGFLVGGSLLGLPPLWAAVLVTFLAMPVGANAFLFANRYGRAMPAVSASVAISTLLAPLTVTIVLALLAGAGLAPLASGLAR